MSFRRKSDLSARSADRFDDHQVIVQIEILYSPIIAIDGARVARNRTEYDAQPVGQQQVAAIRRAIRAILIACQRYVDRGCP